ncbi:uncharacterized protein LOC122399032 [Colletes gigas]|uniref:uncharacterized protein LOC122399032 n=1 Tax=Colletes gigas TaxID=935657 RepID=UPI001C9B06D5|nr:uncharacterized protein LOC122399032 [Colletes gigas]
MLDCAIERCIDLFKNTGDFTIITMRNKSKYTYRRGWNWKPAIRIFRKDWVPKEPPLRDGAPLDSLSGKSPFERVHRVKKSWSRSFRESSISWSSRCTCNIVPQTVFSAGPPPIRALCLLSVVPTIISPAASHSGLVLFAAPKPGFCPAPMVLRRIVGSLFVF